MSGCGASCSLTVQILAAAFPVSLKLLALKFLVVKPRSKLKEFSVSSVLLSSTDAAESVVAVSVTMQEKF